MGSAQIAALRALAVSVALGVLGCTPRDSPLSASGSQPEADASHRHGRYTVEGVPGRSISFETTEGTFMSVDVSPDGETLAFDLLGDLYLLPVYGGEAVPLTSGLPWDQAPRFSPDGKFVYFISDRKGAHNVWRVALRDRTVQQVSASEADVRGTPNWSRKDGRLLAGRGDAEFNRDVILQSIDPDTGAMTPLEEPAGPWVDKSTFEKLRERISTLSGVQAADGRVYFSEERDDPGKGRIMQLFAFDPKTKTRTSITPEGATYSEYKPQLSRNSDLLAWFRQYADRRTEIRVLDRVTGADRPVFELDDADDAYNVASERSQPNYAFTPDNRHLMLSSGGGIRRVDLVDGSSTTIPFHVNVVREVAERVVPSARAIDAAGEAAIIRWPGLSGDGQTLAFAAIGYVWVTDVESGDIRRLTDSTDFEYMPALSPDGQSVAYISVERSGAEYGSGRVMLAGVDGSGRRELLPAADVTYLLPGWSPDGERIALLRETGDGNGIQMAFGWTSLDGPGFNEVATAPPSGGRANLRIFSRHVGFDDTGTNLLFSYPTSIDETVLVSMRLGGGETTMLAAGSPEVGGIVPSPDLRHLALTRDDGTVWVVRFVAEGTPVKVTTAGAHRVSEGGGYYTAWNGLDGITFGFARNVYSYSLNDHELAKHRIRVPFEKTQAARPLAFKGARLITMSAESGAGPVIESGTIVVEGSRIAAVGPVADVEIPSGAMVVDVAGKTVMPGLLDTHYHRIGGSKGRFGGLSAFKLPQPSFGDPTAVAYGVTTAWEPAGPANDGSPAVVDLRAAGRIAGPRWSHSAMGVVGSPFELLDGYGRALEAVTQHKELGVRVLKEYATPTREQRQWLAVAAREAGLGIVSHIEGFDRLMTRVIDGYTGGDHPHLPVPFHKDVQELLRQTGYIWTPNTVITSGSVSMETDAISYYWQHLLETRPWELDKLEALTSGDYIDRRVNADPKVPYSVHRVSRVAAQAAAAAESGVHIGVSAHSMPGVLLHAELWYLRKGGLPAQDVLRAATIGNAAKLGLQAELGSIEPGKMADLLVLDENPLDDIANTLSLKYTVQGGVVYDSETAFPADL